MMNYTRNNEELLQKYKAVEELELLRTREAKLNMKVNWLQSANRQSLEDNNKQVKYTGLLSFAVLLAINLNTIFLAVPCLSQLLIALTKLCLNIPHQDLA